MLRSAFFFAFWWLSFQIRLHIAPWIPSFFATVSIIEVCMLLLGGLREIFEAEHKNGEISNVPTLLLRFDSQIHHVGRALHLGVRGLIWFAVVCASVSIALGLLTIWHHHRVAERVTQHLRLLSALRLITVKVFAVQPLPAEAPLSAALGLLSDALLELKSKKSKSDQPKPISTHAKIPNPRPGRFMRDATILRLQHDHNSFEAIHQWPPGTYKRELGLTMTSAAGRALTRTQRQEELNSEFKGIIYVPWTRCPHAARLWIDESTSPHYRRMDFEPDIFVHLKPHIGSEPKSLICLEIPVPSTMRAKFVLCLDSSRWQCFDEVDFQVAHLMANVLGIVLGRATALSKTKRASP
jgi:hypothetical protein